MKIWGSVPQGTLLGILLFLIMINDLNMPNSSIKYVDDTTVYKLSSQDKMLLNNGLQESADVAVSWSQRNEMQLNPKKCKEMVINFSKMSSNMVLEIVIDDSVIERINSIKVLGVYLNNVLSWNDHVAYVNK